ncbi:MAG TPA: sulfite exporter TauE/SafE family protein [Gemmatimonadales bacterium]|jgi:hypothetical protein
MLTFLVIGFTAGGIGALLGVGGGIILVPGLILAGGLPFTSAVGTSLVCIVATSSTATAEYLRQQRVDLGLGLEMQWYTVLGAVAASLVAASIPAQPLYAAFAILLAVTAVRMWPRTPGRTSGPTTHVVDRRWVAGAGVGAGSVAGLLGIGGGILNVPILHLMLGVPFDRAVATSVYIIGITVASGSAVYLMRGDVEIGAAGATLLGVMVGAALAARWGRQLNQRAVKMAFALLLLYVAARMAETAVSGG